tara:strand:- start:315 stop:1016 length:702 start_codon:yes stop_codon:yes gene_type:complete
MASVYENAVDLNAYDQDKNQPDSQEISSNINMLEYVVARRSEHSTDQIKELAIASACKLIIENGNDGFKARSVAKEMGYTVGTLYYTFGNMEQLRYHVCGSILDNFFTFTNEQLDKKKDRLTFMLIQYVKFSQNHQNLWTFLFSYDTPPKEKLPDWYSQKLKTLFSQLQASFYPYTNGKAAAVRALRVLWAGVHGICVFSLNGRLALYGDNNPETLAKHLLKTYLDGLKKSQQ